MVNRKDARRRVCEVDFSLTAVLGGKVSAFCAVLKAIDAAIADYLINAQLWAPIGTLQSASSKSIWAGRKELENHRRPRYC